MMKMNTCVTLWQPVLCSPALLVPIALTEHRGKPVRAPPALRAGPLLTETVNHPSSWLMVGCSVTDNLNSRQSCTALQIPYGVCKAHMCSRPIPLQRTSWEERCKSDTLGLGPRSGLQYAHMRRPHFST